MTALERLIEWHDIHRDVLLETLDEPTAVEAADRATCQHKKRDRQYSSDVFPDPAEVQAIYRCREWDRCRTCGQVFAIPPDDEDDY